MNPLWMIVALAAIVILRFVTDQKDINRLAREHNLTQLQARGIFRTEIYNTMAANKVSLLIFLAAIAGAIYIFTHTVAEQKVLMPVLTLILGMEIGRFITRAQANEAMVKRINALKDARSQ